jgi:hypothetical protein
MPATDQSVGPDADTERDTAARTDIPPGQRAMVKAACARNYAPRHDSARPYSEIYTQASDASGVILRSA